MERLAGVYNELLNMNVLVETGSYHLKGDCDSILVFSGTRYGIFLDVDKIRTVVQEYEAVTHEFAHIKTNTTYPLDASSLERRRAEVRASREQIRMVVPLPELRDALASGITSTWDLADHFGVSEKTIIRALDYYTGPCGLSFNLLQ